MHLLELDKQLSTSGSSHDPKSPRQLKSLQAKTGNLTKNVNDYKTQYAHEISLPLKNTSDSDSRSWVLNLFSKRKDNSFDHCNHFRALV
ncbi:hypothetical protein IEQ34_003010 [Dendrobium chrysotoxum]|uniref:Uncharacterized protein n=1 Tax=Dendrobium chrysotoxum TaxID=161865 RepID=A0AAV7HI44_DENCH|nr:hypothetical protein IEQ34_003010 [Dendrobium chrysotoxum]